MTDPATKRKWVSLGEVIALLALLVSALGLYLSWRDRQSGPTEVIERKPAVPLVLRGTVEDDGRALAIQPVEATHALDSLTLSLSGGRTITTGSDGRVSASDVERALGKDVDRKSAGTLRATIEARYVENGADRRWKHAYVLRFRWAGGGLFDDRDLRLTGISRA